MARADTPDLDLKMNAEPKEEEDIPDPLKDYFSLDGNHQPVGVTAYSLVIFACSIYCCRVSSMVNQKIARMRVDGR